MRRKGGYVGPSIYHAASIRGGRRNVKIVAAEKETLELFGTILTKHVGDRKLSRYGETRASNYDIFERDKKWLYEADVAVIDVTTPSIGVGREVEMAVQRGLKTLCLSKIQPDGVRLSPQVSGDRNLPLAYYRDADEAKRIVYAFMTGCGYVPKSLEKGRMYS